MRVCDELWSAGDGRGGRIGEQRLEYGVHQFVGRVWRGITVLLVEVVEVVEVGGRIDGLGS
jgi:hypothetical protein